MAPILVANISKLAYATFIGEKEKMIGLRMQYANQDNIVLIPLSSRSTLKMSSLDIKIR